MLQQYALMSKHLLCFCDLTHTPEHLSFTPVVASLRVCADQLLPRKVDLPGNRTAINVVSR